MTALSFSQLLASLSEQPTDQDVTHWAATIPENWMQGRTTYGGLSAALCLKAVQNSHPDLPPLRSAHINFVGPVGGDISITTKIIRRGRSVSFIRAELFGEKGLAADVTFCFAQSRESKLNKQFVSAPQQPSFKDAGDLFAAGPGPAFTQNYECKLASGGYPISGSTEHEHFLWVRHKDTHATDLSALIGIADMPPPAVLPMFTEFAPISSMTWMINILSENLSTEDGWWLLRTKGEHAVDGYSSQDMQVWNSQGELIISGRQNVAIFY